MTAARMSGHHADDPRPATRTSSVARSTASTWGCSLSDRATPERHPLREQRLEGEVADEDALVHVVVAGRDLVVPLDEVRREVVGHRVREGRAEPVRVGEADGVAVGELRLGHVPLQRRADGLGERRRIRRGVAAHHGADPLEVPVGLHAVQRGAHLGEHLLLVVPGQHAAVDAQLDAGRDRRSRPRCCCGRWSARRRSRTAARSCRRAATSRRASWTRASRAVRGSRRRSRSAGESTSRRTSSSDEPSMTSGSSCETSASTTRAAATTALPLRSGTDAWPASPLTMRRNCAVPFSPLSSDVDAAPGALEEVPPALVDHVVRPHQVGAVVHEPAGAADRALLLVGGAGVDERAGGGAAWAAMRAVGDGVGGDQVLDVDGAAAPDVAVVDEARRRAAPASRRRWPARRPRGRGAGATGRAGRSRDGGRSCSRPLGSPTISPSRPAGAEPVRP